MYPCYIGIDEHIMKIKYAFTTYNVFNLKNIILGKKINHNNEFVTWIGYEWVSIDEYLSTTVKSEKEDLLDKKEITINTNSTVVGYIAGYHVTGNQTTYVSPGNFYTMSTEEKLNYLYRLNFNK